MEFMKLFLFVFVELIVVVHSSDFETSLQSTTVISIRPSAFISLSCGIPVLENGSVRLRQRGKLVRFLCLPPFTMIGDKYSACLRGQWDPPAPMCIKPGREVVVPPENGNAVVDMNGAVTKLACRSGYSVAGSHETYCNGTAWDRSLGSCRETVAGPAMSCDFEVSSMCDWTTDPTLPKWTRKNGYTRQLQNGPPHDNIVGVPFEGHFMLATFAPQSPNSVARLISPLYPAQASNNACFRFYYHMYGASTGVLRFYLKPISLVVAEILNSSKTKYLFMEKKGLYENSWLESIFTIDEFNEDFQIIIEATAMNPSI